MKKNKKEVKFYVEEFQKKCGCDCWGRYEYDTYYRIFDKDMNLIVVSRYLPEQPYELIN